MSAGLPGKPRVAVFSPNQDAPSETFIRAHIERLPMETLPIFGSRWRRFDRNGRLWPLLAYPGWAVGEVTPAAGAALYARVLASKLKQMKVDVVLAEYGMTGAEIQDACRLAGVPLVTYFYGFDAWSKPVIEKYLTAYKRMFSDAAALIAVSASIAKRLTDWGAPPDKIHKIVCGADVHRFHGADPAKAEPHFVAVGRFVEKKAPYLTMLAFREVVAAQPAARLSMVGDGPLLGPTRRLAAALGLGEKVTFHGVRTPEEVADLLRAARAFVQHSLTAEDGDSEGTPVAIVEAQAAGLPVVSTRHSGIPDVVADGETGLLVNEGDATGMGRMMAQLAVDPALAGKLGKAGRERALALFSLEEHLRKLAEVLRSAASRTAR